MTKLADKIAPPDSDEESVRHLNQLLSKKKGRWALIRLIKQEIEDHKRREANITYTRGYSGS